LNFALNLEYLEAEYYLRAVSGVGLSSADRDGTGTLGPVIVRPTARCRLQRRSSASIAEEIARDELAHVRFLRTALGNKRVASPTIDLLNSFNTAAQLAGLGNSLIRLRRKQLFTGRLFLRRGCDSLQRRRTTHQNSGILEAAAGILADRSDITLPKYSTIVSLIYARPASPGGENHRNCATTPMARRSRPGIVDGNGNANIVPTDENAIAFSRTPRQVLSIVYLTGQAGGSASSRMA
jgi:hypothetical protein